MIKINEQLPNFELEAYHENKIKKINLEDYKGKWLILMFYPADFTFICPTELGDMAYYYPEFQKMNAEVMSVSTDTAFSHKAWHDESPIVQKINFPMVADPTGKLTKKLGVYIKEEGLALRGTFIFNPDGQLQAYEINNNNIGRNAAETLRKLQAAIFVRNNGSEVCPANWQPGRETLKPGVDLVGKL